MATCHRTFPITFDGFHIFGNFLHFTLTVLRVLSHHLLILRARHSLYVTIKPAMPLTEITSSKLVARSGCAQYPAHRGRAFVWLGFRRMQSDFFRAGRPVGHSAKFLCEIGLKAPSKIDGKNVRRGLLDGVDKIQTSSPN